MSALLRGYIAEILNEMRSNPAVSNQLLPRKPKKQSGEKPADKDSEEENEMGEMSVAANVAGFTGPLGASSEDLKGPGAGPRSKKKSSARWK
jgi:hypothetical protein